MHNKGRRFLNLEFVHPDSAGESNLKTYLEKAIFDILIVKSQKSPLIRLEFFSHEIGRDWY